MLYVRSILKVCTDNRCCIDFESRTDDVCFIDLFFVQMLDFVSILKLLQILDVVSILKVVLVLDVALILKILHM